MAKKWIVIESKVRGSRKTRFKEMLGKFLSDLSVEDGIMKENFTIRDTMSSPVSRPPRGSYGNCK